MLSNLVAKLLCFCLYLFDTIIELHALDENDFLLLESESAFHKSLSNSYYILLM